MTVYSYKKASKKHPELGATVYENEKAIFVTAHKNGMKAGDHDDLAEYICSALFMVGLGKDMDITGHDENCAEEVIAQFAKQVVMAE